MSVLERTAGILDIASARGARFLETRAGAWLMLVVLCDEDDDRFSGNTEKGER